MFVHRTVSTCTISIEACWNANERQNGATRKTAQRVRVHFQYLSGQKCHLKVDTTAEWDVNM